MIACLLSIFSPTEYEAPVYSFPTCTKPLSTFFLLVHFCFPYLPRVHGFCSPCPFSCVPSTLTSCTSFSPVDLAPYRLHLLNAHSCLLTIVIRIAYFQDLDRFPDHAHCESRLDRYMIALLPSSLFFS